MKVFIPIKKESQRVPRKNFRIFRGLPLYQHFIYKIINESEYKVFVDTDSQKVINWSKNEDRVFAYQREEELRGHEVSVNRIIHNFIEKFDVNESVAQLHVTSPFLEVSTIKEASKYLEKEEYDSVVGCDVLYERFWKKNGNGMRALNHDKENLIQTQDLNPLYVENSTFYIFESQIFSNRKNRIGNNPYFFEVEYPENIDIDTEEDWKFAKNI